MPKVQNMFETMKEQIPYTTPYGTIWVHMDPTWVGSIWLIWAHMGLYGLIWTHMGPHGSIWDDMGPYGPHMGST